MPFRPDSLPTLVGLPLAAALIGLGVWQADLWLDKTVLTEEIAMRGAAPAIEFSTDSRVPLEDFLYRPIVVTGQFNHGAEFLLIDQPDDGPPGFHVITPLLRSDGQGELLVDRGWIPADRRDPADRRGSRSEGEVTITGIFRPPEPPGWRTPENDAEKNQWYFMDMEEMSRVARIWPPPDYYLMATSGWGSEWPRPHDGRIVPVNNHLSYAIGSFALAVVLMAAYAGFRKFIRARRDDA